MTKRREPEAVAETKSPSDKQLAPGVRVGCIQGHQFLQHLLRGIVSKARPTLEVRRDDWPHVELRRIVGGDVGRRGRRGRRGGKSLVQEVLEAATQLVERLPHPLCDRHHLFEDLRLLTGDAGTLKGGAS
jgi:hypothetical protein